MRSIKYCLILILMNKYLSVVFILLFSNVLQATNLNSAINNLEQEWAKVYYSTSKSKGPTTYPSLITKASALTQEFPDEAEPLLWQAILISSNAGHLAPIDALRQITKARDLLIQAIHLAPKGLNGSAHVTLGTLYYMTPAWPLSFGDNAKAQELLTSALKINPDSIEANYFYGDFLLNQDDPDRAEYYFKKAVSAPVRNHQRLADQSLQKQAKLALEGALQNKVHDSKKLFLSLFSSADEP